MLLKLCSCLSQLHKMTQSLWSTCGWYCDSSIIWQTSIPVGLKSIFSNSCISSQFSTCHSKPQLMEQNHNFREKGKPVNVFSFLCLMAKQILLRLLFVSQQMSRSSKIRRLICHSNDKGWLKVECTHTRILYYCMPSLLILTNVKSVQFYWQAHFFSSILVVCHFE